MAEPLTLTPEQATKLLRLLSSIESVVPYVAATLPGHVSHSTRKDAAGQWWGECHLGRSASSQRQLEGIRELARELAEEVDRG